MFGFEPKENSAKKIENLKQETKISQPKIKDIKSEIKITELQIRDINKRKRYLQERNPYCTELIQELETRDNGPASVYTENLYSAYYHIWICKGEISANNEKLQQLMEQHSKLRSRINTLNSQLLEMQNKLAK